MKKCTLKFLGVKKHYYFLALIIMLGFLISPHSALAISNKINYSGRLMDSSGNAITRTVTMQFSIYSSSSGGSSLWTETKSVSVSNSYFSVVLGDTNTISLDFSSSDYYLGIKVGDDSEMTPRKYIGSAPYAMNADKVDGADAGTSANNVLKLNSSGGIDIAGKIRTTNDLDAGSSILDTLTVEGATSLQNTLSVSGTANFTGNLQLGGVTITSTASELNIMDGVIASTAEINVLDDGINFSELSGTSTDAQIPDTITAVNYLLLAGGTMAGAIDMGNTNITNIAQLALTPRTDGTTTEGYIYYDSDTDAFYGRTAADWVNFAGDGGDITSVTAGNGLTGGGTSGDVTLDIAAGDTTITVAANSIVVGTIGSANITDGALTADDLATSSVATAEILNATIINEDISVTAAIDATKIGGGAVSSTEFSYLDGVTSAIQTQFSNYLLLAGGTLTGDLAITTSDFDVTLGAADGASFTSNAAATADVLTITAATATDGVAGLYVEMSDNSTTGFINAIDVNLDVTTALLAAGRARGINVDVTGIAGDHTDSSVMGIRLNGTDVSDADLVGINYNGQWDYGIYMNNGTVFNTAEIKLSGGGTALMGETIANTTDDMIDFGGVGGTDNTDLRFDLDGTMPVISSQTDSAIGFDDNISFIGAQTVDGVDISTISTTYLLLAGGTMTGDLTVNDNDIIGTTGLINYTNFDIDSGGSLTINNVGNTGSVTVEGTILDINDLTFTGTGTVSSGAGTALTITANAASTWSTSDGALTINGNDGLNLNTTDGGGVNINPVGGSDLNVNINGSAQMYIGGNALSELSTLYIDADLAAGTTVNSGIYLYYQPDGADAVIYDQAMRIFLEGTNIDESDTYDGLAINVANSSDAPDTLLELTNASNAGTVGQAIDIWAASGGDFTDGILFNGVSGNGNVTDAIDASYANITNAINIGANNIEGTNFDVDGNGNITIAATQGLDTNAAGDLEIGATNATSVSIGTEDTAKPVYLKGPIGGFSTWSGRETGAWTNGDPSTITVNLAGMDANDLVIITPVTRTVNAEGTLDYWVTSNAGSFTVSSSSSAGAFTETLDFNWIVIRQ